MSDWNSPPILVGQTPHPVKLRVAFAGTPAFALPSLRALLEYPKAEIVAVYTQPDRTAGRGQRLRWSAVKTFSVSNGLTVEQPASWKNPETIAHFKSYCPDILIVAAYGVILPESALRIPAFGALNVHASLLPRWRGAAPIQRAIMAGDRISGVTIMQIVPELDAGPILIARECDITAHDTAGSVEQQLSLLGADTLLAALELWLAGKVVAREQLEAEVTYATKITRVDRELDWTRSALALDRQTRALFPAPLAYTETLGLPVNVLRSALVDSVATGSPGLIVGLSPQGIDVVTSQGVLRLLEVQPLGKRAMSAKDFLNGYGQRLSGGR